MPWDLGDLNPAVQFDLGDEWIKLRIASDEDNKKFFNTAGVKETVEYRRDPKTRQMQRLTYFSPSEEQREKFNEEVWDFSIVDWNIFTSDGEKIPCTRENKIKFMRYSPKFATWVAECLEQLSEDLKVYNEEVRKN